MWVVAITGAALGATGLLVALHAAFSPRHDTEEVDA